MGVSFATMTSSINILNNDKMKEFTFLILNQNISYDVKYNLFSQCE